MWQMSEFRNLDSFVDVGGSPWLKASSWQPASLCSTGCLGIAAVCLVGDTRGNHGLVEDENTSWDILGRISVCLILGGWDYCILLL